MKEIEYSITLIEGGDNSISGIHYRMMINTCDLTNRIVDILDKTDSMLNKLMWQHREYHYDKDLEPYDKANYNQILYLEFRDFNRFNYFIYELEKMINQIKELDLLLEMEVK